MSLRVGRNAEGSNLKEYFGRRRGVANRILHVIESSVHVRLISRYRGPCSTLIGMLDSNLSFDFLSKEDWEELRHFKQLEAV